MNYRDAYLSMESKENGKYQGDGINYYNLGIEGLESALKSFDDPEYILLSEKKGKIELILKGEDYKGRRLFSIVALNTTTQNNNKFMDVHVVTSVYGNKGIQRRIDIAKKEQRLIYKKEEPMQGISQVQYERDINADSSTDRISQNEENVNSFSEEMFQDRIEPPEPSNSKQVMRYERGYHELSKSDFYENSIIYSYDFLVN